MSQLFDSLPVYFKTLAVMEHQNGNIFPLAVNGEVASLWHCRLISSKSERTFISKYLMCHSR